MTTTTANEKTTKPVDLDAELGSDEAIGQAIGKGQQTSGGFDGPSWVPTLAEAYNSDLKPEALAAKVAKCGAGSTTRKAIAGKLAASYAWGRRMYFLDVTTKTQGVVRVKLPETKILYTGLNLCELGAQVGIRFDGFGVAKPRQKPPAKYTVSSLDRPALTVPRKDSIVPESMDEREEKKKAAELAKVRAQNAAAGIGDDEGGPEADDADVTFP